MSIFSSISSNLLSGSSLYDTSSLQSDPRRFTVQHCDAKADARRRQLEASKQTGLISGISKLAGIEGTGKAQEILDVIASASRAGGSDLERLINGGAEGILQMLLGDDAAKLVSGTLNNVNPQAINTAIKSANSIYDKLKNQDFDWRDIPQYVGDFRALFTNIKTIGSPFLDSFLGAGSTAPMVRCSASPYAVDLVNLGTKFKFLFVAEFSFYAEYQPLITVSPAFVVKSIDRPSIAYEYDDINMYNFRTKVIKKATLNPITLSFYDDEQNHATAFYNALFRLMSPVGNQTSPDLMEQNGMNFKEGAATNNAGPDSNTQGIQVIDSSASIGAFLGNRTSVIEFLDVYHVFMSGQKINHYRFYRPRILNMTLDSLDMTSEQVTELKMELVYDSVEIVNQSSDAIFNQIDSRTGVQYPLGGQAAPNILPAASMPTTVNAAGYDGSDDSGGFLSNITASARRAVGGLF